MRHPRSPARSPPTRRLNLGKFAVGHSPIRRPHLPEGRGQGVVHGLLQQRMDASAFSARSARWSISANALKNHQPDRSAGSSPSLA